MKSTESKAKTENVVKPAGEVTWKCDGDTLKGEDSCYSLTRTFFRLENCSMLIFTVERELSFNLRVLIKYSIAFPSIHSKQ